MYNDEGTINLLKNEKTKNGQKNDFSLLNCDLIFQIFDLKFVQTSYQNRTTLFENKKV